MKLASRIAVFFLIIILSGIINAAQAASYYFPRGTIWGLAGSENQARLDVLLPLLSNPDNLLYTDVQGGYAQDDGSYANIGAGVRKVLNNSNLFGAYLFIERDESKLHNVFTVLSPGIEAFSPDWDVRVNGYFPVSERRKTIDFFASETGDCRFVVFKGHQQFDNKFSVFEEAGPGGDAEVGYTFHRLNNAQLHAGVYAFHYNGSNSPNNFCNSPNHIICNSPNHITGVEGRLEVPVNPFWAVTVESSYDNFQHGTVVGGLRFNFIGATPNTANIRNHMVDPITRNLGSLKTGNGIPTVKYSQDEGSILLRDNIWFFAPGGSIFNPALGTNQGTIDDPLSNTSLSTTTLTSINVLTPNANMYLAPGNYTVSSASPSSDFNGLVFNSGQSLYGRTDNFKCPAPINNRPLILGSIELPGNDIVSDVNLTGVANQSSNKDDDFLNNNTALLSVYINNANKVTLNNVSVSGYAAANGTSTSINGVDAIGIDIENSTDVVLNNVIVSNIAAGNGFTTTGGGGAAAGILSSNSQVTANGVMAIDTISGGAGKGNNNNGNSAFGLFATNASTVTANNGISINTLTGGNGNNSSLAGYAIGIQSDTNSFVNAAGGISISELTGGTNPNVGINAGPGGGAIGIFAFSGTVNATGGITINMLKSGDNSSTTGFFEQAYGIIAYQQGVVTCDGDMMINNIVGGNGTTGNAHGSPAYGIWEGVNSRVSVTNGSVKINSIAGGHGSGNAAGGNGTGIFQLGGCALTVTNGGITINNISSGGGGATSGVASAFGIYQQASPGGPNSITVTNGGIDITNIIGGNGTGTGNGDNAYGVYFSGAGNSVTATSNINIDTILGGNGGTGAPGGNAAGVQNQVGNTISAFTATNVHNGAPGGKTVESKFEKQFKNMASIEPSNFCKRYNIIVSKD